MAMALILPIVLVLIGKWEWKDIGFCRINITNSKKVFYFIPILMIFIPVAFKGFYIKSIGYVLGCLFLYLFVGISEEVYFRGIIPRYLVKEFSIKGQMLVSTLIFGVGHIATAFAGDNTFEIALTILNALIFGWLAIGITIISQNIIPAILVHFLFDFETKIVAIKGSELLIAEGIRGALMFIVASCFTVILYKKRDTL